MERRVLAIITAVLVVFIAFSFLVFASTLLSDSIGYRIGGVFGVRDFSTRRPFLFPFLHVLWLRRDMGTLRRLFEYSSGK